MKKKTCLYFSLVLFVALVIFVLVSSTTFPTLGITYGFGPALFPRIVCVGILVCVLIIFIQTLLDKEMSKEKIEIRWADFKRLLVLLCAVVVYAAMLEYLGFLVMNTAFLLFTLKYYKNKWGLAIFSSVLLTASLYVVFKIVLRVPLPFGAIFGI